MSAEGFPNARDCKHGHLARSCEICELERQVEELRAELADVRDDLVIANQRGDAFRALSFEHDQARKYAERRLAEYADALRDGVALLSRVYAGKADFAVTAREWRDRARALLSAPQGSLRP